MQNVTNKPSVFRNSVRGPEYFFIICEPNLFTHVDITMNEHLIQHAFFK